MSLIDNFLYENDEILAIFSLIIFVISIILSFYFWIELVPCETPFNCNNSSFDAHGISWQSYLIFSIILLEIIFFYFISKNQRKKRESIFSYTLNYKLLALGLMFLVFVILIPMGYYLIKLWYHLIWILGIAGLIGLYYLLNVGLTKIFGKTKKQKEDEDE